MQLSRYRAVAFLTFVLGCAAPQFTGSTVQAQSSNGVLREVYLNIDGNTVASLTSHPSFSRQPVAGDDSADL